MSRYIDVHIIQSVPPSNLNRDDTGAPKSAVYGGVRRSRVSSQAWKRATRKSFKDELDVTALGYRTKQAAALIGVRMRTLDPDMPEEDRAERAGAVLKALGMKLEPKRKKPTASETDAEHGTLYESSSYLMFFSSEQLDQLAGLALRTEGAIPKKEAQAQASAHHGVAVSLFGRMVADDKTLNVDAAVQVAHALSTHAVDTEADYYTAVDDFSEESDESGAGMIGTIEFNSATLYRYANVNVNGLVDNLGDAAAAARAAAAFVKCFVTSMPTGKQNTFANGTLPDGVVVVVRDDQPVNFVGAFEVPVGAGEGLVQRSCEQLAAYATEIEQAYGVAPSASYVLGVGERAAALSSLGETVTLTTLSQAVRDVVTDAAPSQAV